MRRSFVVCLIPSQVSFRELAVAAVRGGSRVLLDVRDVDEAFKLVASITEACPTARLGIRICAQQLSAVDELLRSLGGCDPWLVVSEWSNAIELSELGADVQPWLEVHDVALLERVPRSRPVGVLVRGAECGGLTGSTSAFVLSQAALRKEFPVLVQGDIGPATAAACLRAGAVAVVLHDELFGLEGSPLMSRHWRELSTLTAADTTIVGRPLGVPVRLIGRADHLAAQRLAKLALELEASDIEIEEARARWRRELTSSLGWGDPSEAAWPAGTSLCRAAAIGTTHRRVGRYLARLRRAITSVLSQAQEVDAFAPDGPFAKARGTRLPIFQGPMTRVSDTPDFAAAVAAEGALPFLALALMRGPEVTALMRRTRARLGGAPLGVGILGFVNDERRAEQLAALAAEPPDVAIVAGGRPDQALRLEQAGVPTFLHAPTPALLRLFVEQGARRFVLEGSECGGHVGPLSSFGLWQAAVDVLLEVVPAHAEDPVDVVFAGGIHDGLSAGMAATIAAPLVAHGIRVGLLMGTAYVFTHEAVTSGAITATFQAAAIGCGETRVIELGPGHAIRCVPSPFVGEFDDRRRSLLRSEPDAGRRSEQLEALTRGRARVASKSLERADGSDVLVSVGATESASRGMFMIGALAALQDRVRSIADLHRDVIEGAAVRRPVTDEPATPQPPRPLDIAVVGMACQVPGASEPQQLWRNLLDGVGAIQEIPRSRFDWRLYYDGDVQAPDGIISRWGGFIDEAPFDPIAFRLPPTSLGSISTTQLWALELTRRALEDAGWNLDDFDRTRTAVIIGTASPGDLQHYLITRAMLPALEPMISDAVRRRLPAWTEQSHPGVLGNVTAGRVANRFDFGGASFTVDAACASSLAALDLATRELTSGRADTVIVGGLELELSPFTFACFSKTRALSPTGQARVFDQDADGIVISEGAVVLLLKRLTDAERDGDTIYGLIRGVAGSSDGQRTGITAPTTRGQQRAVERALAEAGVRVDELGVYEAHGTGTRLGDQTEIDSIDGLLRSSGATPKACAVGSTKHLLGHTRSAAGLVGLVKALMAVRHGTLPPHVGVQRPLHAFERIDAPVALYGEATPWLSAVSPRRAGVSAFGFGGSNYHAIVEEYRGGSSVAPGAPSWPVELVLLRAADRDRLLERVRSVIDGLERERWSSLAELARAQATASQVEPASAPTVACVVESMEKLRRALLAVIDMRDGDPLPARVHVRMEPLERAPKLALLFPGQGSQSPGMGRELSLYVDEMRRAMTEAEAALGSTLSRLVWPPTAFDDARAAAQAAALSQTHVAQPALAAVSAGLVDLLRRLRLQPEAVAGHSFGELVALYAAGVIEIDALMRLAVTRGALMSDAAAGGDGGMLAITRSAEEVVSLLERWPSLTIANVNAPDQTVVAGPREDLEQLLQQLGSGARLVPVACAFHSPAMRGAREPWREVLATVDMRPPRVPVHGCADGQPLGSDPNDILDALADQLEAPVRFVDQIQALADRGCELFVEVGPGTVLSNLARRVLGPQRGRVIPLLPMPGDLAQTLAAVAELAAVGVELDVLALLDVRGLDRPVVRARAQSSAQYRLGGGSIRRVDEPEALVGEAPLLDQDTARVERDNLARATNVDAESTPLAAYRAYQDTMQRFLDVQRQVFGEVMERLGVPDAGGHVDIPAWSAPVELDDSSNGRASDRAAEGDLALEPAGEQELPPAPIVVRTRAELTTLIRDIVSRITGYPTDLIGPDMDIETQLGIDSIKRIEIYAAIEAAIPNPPSGLQARLAGKRKLAQVVDELVVSDEAPPAVVAPTIVAAPVDEPPAVAPGRACPRFEMIGEPSPLIPTVEMPSWGVVLVTGEPHGHAGIVASELRLYGFHTELLHLSHFEHPDALAAQMAAFEGAAIRGIVHLTAIDRPLERRDNLESWRARTQVHVKGLFQLLQACRGSIESATPDHPFQVLAATCLGGRWGRDDGPTGGGDPTSGGIHGLLATLSASSPATAVRVVDFDRTGSIEWTAATLVQEFFQPEGPSEVGYTRGERLVFFPRAAPLRRPSLEADEATRDWRPAAGDVVLVTGGARGITATVTRSLARSGVRLIVVGSTPLADIEAPAELPSEAAVRRRFIDESSGGAVPAEIDAQARRAHAELERAWTLAQLEQAGALVEYHACDVADEQAFSSLLADLYARFGRIDAVIHGAGIKADSRLAHKTLESFDRVFDTKADSAWILWRHLRPAGLRWVVLFSSIAGRFGNQGQWDYAAANEVLGRLAWRMRADWPRTHVVSVCWGPWRGGMVTPALAKRFERDGIDVIEPPDGLRFLHDELATGTSAEVVAGRGPWANLAAPTRRATLLDLLTAALETIHPRPQLGSAS